MPPKRLQKRTPAMQNRGRGMPGQRRQSQRPLVADPRQRQPQARPIVRPMMPRISRGGRMQEYEARRKSWAGIPIIGGLIELLKSIIYRQEANRVAKRMSHRQILKAPGAKARGRELIAAEQRKYGYEPTKRGKAA